MPRKSERIKLAGTMNDRRRKLTNDQKDEIHARFHSGGISQRALAREYGVSRSTIRFIAYPEKLKENLAIRKKRGGSKIYYDKDTHTKAMRKHRNHKKELYSSGKVKIEGSLDKTESLIVKYLAEGIGQTEISRKLKSMNISPNSVSTIEKRIRKIKLSYGANSLFHLGVLLTKKGEV